MTTLCFMEGKEICFLLTVNQNMLRIQAGTGNPQIMIDVSSFTLFASSKECSANNIWDNIYRS